MTKQINCCRTEHPCTKDNYVGRDKMTEDFLDHVAFERDTDSRKRYAFLFNCPECHTTKTLITESRHGIVDLLVRDYEHLTESFK